MRKFILTILSLTIAFGASALMYFIGAALGSLLATVLPGFPTDIAKGLAAVPLGGIKSIYELLETGSAKREFAKTGLSSAIHMNEFSIHPVSAFFLCFITWFGVILFTNFLMGTLLGFAAGVSKVKMEDLQRWFVPLVIYTSLPLRIIAAAHLGSWIGTRSRRYVIGILIGGIVFGSHAFLLWGQLMASGYDFNMLSEDRTLSQHIAFLPHTVIFVISAIPGFWYGQRQKLAYYLTFIMRMLPQELRQTIVEMARDEAKRASPALHAAPSRSA
jgi:hypothetical protein